MKIIIVGQYYWPEQFLINEIAEDLVVRGHSVTVLTGLPDYSTNYVPEEYKHGKNRKEIRNGVEIIRVPVIARRTGVLFRALNYLSFMFTSSWFVRTHKLEADVIMAYQTAPVFMGNAAIILKKKLNKPLFFYCLDIWPDQMKVWGVYEDSLIFKIVHKYCEHAYSSANILGISSMPFKKYMEEINHVDAEKIVYLPQHSVRMDIKDKNLPKKQIDLIFAGNIGQQQNVECLLKAISKVETKKLYKVHIFGSGTSYAKCLDMAKDLNLLDRVMFYGRVDKSTLVEAYAKMDAFLLTLCPEKKIGFTANTVPGKFQEYMSVGKPILAAIDGGAREIIEKTKCGLVVAADDDVGYAKIIEEYIENTEEYYDCGKRGKEHFNIKYDKKIVMDQLEVYLNNLYANGE